MNEFIRFLQYLIVSLDGLSTGILFELILTGKKEGWKWKLIRPVLFFIQVLLICLPSYLLGRKIQPMFNLVATFLLDISMILLLYHASVLKAMILFLAYYGCALCAEFCAPLIDPEIFAQMMDWTSDPMLKVLVLVFLLAFLFKLSFAGYIRFRDHQLTRFQTVLLPLLWMMLIIGLNIYKLMNLSDEMKRSSDFILWQAYYVIPLCIISVYGVFLFLVWKRKEKAKVQSLENALKQQEEYYLALTDSLKMQEKARHDLKNILLTIQGLLSQHQSLEALQLLEDLKVRYDPSLPAEKPKSC